MERLAVSLALHRDRFRRTARSRQTIKRRRVCRCVVRDVEGAGGSCVFEVTFEKNPDAVVGKVSVTGEPTYKASFKALAFEGKKMNAKYDFPPNAADAEVWLTATFDGNRANGTWSLRVKADGSEVAAG